MKHLECCASPHYAKADVYAMQALMTGTANEQQQKRALAWIIHHACMTYHQSFRPGVNGDRDTCFAEGRRFVGNQIIRLTKLDPKKLDLDTERTNTIRSK